MTREADRLLQEAMKLPPDARAALAGSLLESLDTTVNEDAETAWAEEIAKRVRDLDEGLVRPVPWVEVRRRIASQ